MWWKATSTVLLLCKSVFRSYLKLIRSVKFESKQWISFNVTVFNVKVSPFVTIYFHHSSTGKHKGNISVADIHFIWLTLPAKASYKLHIYFYMTVWTHCGFCPPSLTLKTLLLAIMNRIITARKASFSVHMDTWLLFLRQTWKIVNLSFKNTYLSLTILLRNSFIIMNMYTVNCLEPEILTS